MYRLLSTLIVVVAVLASAGPARADLWIVQQWPVDTFPGGICYDADRNHIWLVNNSTDQVREYTRDGTFIGMFPGTDVGLNWPIGIDICGATNHLWVGDEYSPEKVVECTREGTQVSWFSVDADMDDVSGVAYNPNNTHLYIADDNTSQVVEWTTDGTLVTRWSCLPCVDADAICYLSCIDVLLLGDDNAGDVYQFTLDGQHLLTYDMSVLGITGVEGLSSDPATGTVFLADSDSYIIYEIGGFFGPSLTEQSSWGSIKGLFR